VGNISISDFKGVHILTKKLIVICFLISILLSSTGATNGNTTDIYLFRKELDTLERQDGRFISKLQWISPTGETPGTYKEYIERHPLTPALFSTPDIRKPTLFPSGKMISLLVDKGLYPKVTAGLDQYINDLESEGYSILLQTVSGGKPDEIKKWIKERYEYYGCTGFILIGDVTAAWAEVSGSVFPCDLFYMDLDGQWEDSNHDGIYETHTRGHGDMGPEVYVARINAHTLTYDTEADMINEYFAKTHAYRIGDLKQPWRGLEYIDEDWYYMEVYLDRIYEDEVVRHDYGYFTTAEDYLDQMDLGQHFVQVCAHSWTGGHYFSTRPTESACYAHVYVYTPIRRVAKLLLGYDDGIKIWLNGVNVYTDDVLGGWKVDEHEVDVTLFEGWNRLLCKVSQEGGEYKFSARFADNDYQSFNDLHYQINNPELYKKEPEFIRSWLLNGFHRDSSDNFWNYLTTNYLGVDEASINPSEGDTTAGKKWNIYNSGCLYVDMSEYCDYSDFGVCYAFVRIYADSEKNCQLWMGYDDGARVWLNSQEILYDNRYGGFEDDMTKVNVTLKAGENRLLIKVSEWMGAHGFSARICNSDGSVVEGLTYDPLPTPIAHIGSWLINGPYLNPDQNTRLSTDYLQGEENISPSQGDPAPFGRWERGMRNGCPFDLAVYFDHGDWVSSQDIQKRDPPVLFYNLFSCGPGRFTEKNYLAGAYIFNTTYGLITVASSKSGSMLNFADFTTPLGEGKNFGESFREWFDRQAPYQQWEQEWYYGMVLCGDPTLCVTPQKDQKLDVKITRPTKAIYIKDEEIIPFFKPLIVGDITVKAEVLNTLYGVNRVEFYVNDELKKIDTTEPYTWKWDEKTFFRHTLKATAFDNHGNSATDKIFVSKFF
jgi:hypothetical protein